MSDVSENETDGWSSLIVDISVDCALYSWNSSDQSWDTVDESAKLVIIHHEENETQHYRLASYSVDYRVCSLTLYPLSIGRLTRAVPPQSLGEERPRGVCSETTRVLSIRGERMRRRSDSSERKGIQRGGKWNGFLWNQIFQRNLLQGCDGCHH